MDISEVKEGFASEGMIKINFDWPEWRKVHSKLFPKIEISALVRNQIGDKGEDVEVNITITGVVVPEKGIRNHYLLLGFFVGNPKAPIMVIYFPNENLGFYVTDPTKKKSPYNYREIPPLPAQRAENN